MIQQNFQVNSKFFFNRYDLISSFSLDKMSIEDLILSRVLNLSKHDRTDLLRVPFQYFSFFQHYAATGPREVRTNIDRSITFVTSRFDIKD